MRNKVCQVAQSVQSDSWQGQRISPLACVQTGPGAHSASCTMGTGGPFPGGKEQLRHDAAHLPHLVPKS
jgi:hypothetical protein